VLRHDLTELEGLDFLAYPDGPIREAQELAAATFGADATWFLVNGTTVGIQASIPRSIYAVTTVQTVQATSLRFRHTQYAPLFLLR
jgi:arginine/lysine/ornithine decarboxylase